MGVYLFALSLPLPLKTRSIGEVILLGGPMESETKDRGKSQAEEKEKEGKKHRESVNPVPNSGCCLRTYIPLLYGVLHSVRTV